MTKRVLVTGGNRGIGKAISDRFRNHGYDVITPSRTEMNLASVKSICDYVERNKAFPVDILINNAAENQINYLRDLSIAEWQRVITVNLTAPFMLIHLMAPHMVNRRWGRIVNVSSCYSLVSRAGRASYSASKAGLNSLTRSAALEFAAFNIMVNAVCPGFVETDLTKKNNNPEQIADLCKQIPIGRLGTPDEVADWVFILGSEQNSYTTGQVIIVDGGFMAQ